VRKALLVCRRELAAVCGGPLAWVLGAVFLLANVGVFRFVRWDLVWPLVLVGAGALLLAQRARR